MKERNTRRAVHLQSKTDTLQSNSDASKTIDKTLTDEQVWSNLLKRELEPHELAIFGEALTGFFKALIQAKRNTQHG